MLNRALVRLTLKLFILAYSAIVRSHLAGPISLSHDINKLETIQKATTRLIHNLCELSYELVWIV